MATITLAYQLDATKTQLPPSLLSQRMAAVQLEQGELDLLGYTVLSDTMANAPGSINRVVVLQTTAQSDLNFPDDASKIYSVRSLYKARLSLGLPGIIVNPTPVVT